MWNKIWNKFRDWIEARMAFVIVIGILYALFAIILAILWGNRTPIGNVAVPWDWLWLAAVTGYTLASITRVETREKAVKTFFKRDIQNVPAGLTFVPYLICDLIPFDKIMIFLEVGTPQEISIRGEEGEIIGTKPAEPGKETLRASTEPLRVTFASFVSGIWKKRWFRTETYTNEEKKELFPVDDHLNRRLTSDPNVVTWFTIRDQRQFVTIMGSREKALELMEKVIMVALQEYCSKRTLAFVLHHLEDAQDYLRHRLEQLVGDLDAKNRAAARVKEITVPTEKEYAKEMLLQGWEEKDSWGVDVHGVKIKTMGLPRRVNEALADARQAGYQADAVAIRAEGEKKRLELEAKGKRADEREVLLGRMEGYKRLINLGLTPEQVLAADTGRAVAENVGNLLVTDSSILANTIGAIAAGKGVLTGQPTARLPKKRRPKTDSGDPPSVPPPIPPPPANP